MCHIIKWNPMFLTLGLETKSRQTCYAYDVLTKLSFPWEGSLCFWQLQFTCLSRLQMLNYGTPYRENCSSYCSVIIQEHAQPHGCNTWVRVQEGTQQNLGKQILLQTSLDVKKWSMICLTGLSHFINPKLIIIIVIVFFF